MEMNLSQTKLVGLTMKLDLKTREFRKLCEELDKLEKENIDENDERLIKLKKEFEENQTEIQNINTQLEKLNVGTTISHLHPAKYNELPNYLSHNVGTSINNLPKETSIVTTNEGFFHKIIQKILKILKK